ncbi:MAG: NUDIX domain-containing protein [Phycisphaerales bacterium]|nr:NUDIX domain-containing protein [Phycisphaerales bacterium]
MAPFDPTSPLAQHLATAPELPFKIAVLVYLYDHADRLLMLRRAKPPNPSMYSPIGGKIEFHQGESPHECALREISEEAGLTLDYHDIRLMGVVSERAYQGQHHWMIFLFESVTPVDATHVTRMHFDEGQLEWIPLDRIADLALPDTDRRVMWPNAQKHRGGFFMVQIDCTKTPFDFRLVESAPALTR